jgi:hypothetical protein
VKYPMAAPLVSNHNSFDTATIGDIPTANKSAVKHIELGFTIKNSLVDDANTAQRMLAQGVAGWQQAVSQKCSNVTYDIEVEGDDGPCDKMPPLGLRDLTRVAKMRRDGLEPLVTTRGVELRKKLRPFGRLCCSYVRPAALCRPQENVPSRPRYVPGLIRLVSTFTLRSFHRENEADHYFPPSCNCSSGRQFDKGRD